MMALSRVINQIVKGLKIVIRYGLIVINDGFILFSPKKRSVNV